MMRLSMAALRPQVTELAVTSSDSRSRHDWDAHVDAPARLERDPVCGMMVDERDNQYTYRDIGYAFCSAQCRERFAAAPGLYVGRRGALAPKQKGVAVIKQTRISLDAPLSDGRFGALAGALLSMMGVIAVRRVGGATAPGSGRCAEAAIVTYDLLQATAAQLERRIAQTDTPLSDAWGERLLRDFVRYAEQCELDDLVPRNADQSRRKAAYRRGAPNAPAGGGARFGRGGRAGGG